MFESILFLNTLKILHIVAVISWMAGLLYLPRIFVYHSETDPLSATSEVFKTMERKLFYYIMNPAMIVTWICGLYLAFAYQYYKFAWFQLKLSTVILLTVFHFIMLKKINLFKNNKNFHSSRYYRLNNEVPTLLMVIIVILVVAKPV